MKRYIALLVLVASLLPGLAAAQGGDHALIVPAGQHVAGNIATVTQDIEVYGAVDGDVTSWSGNITVSGAVGGDVISYGGHVLIGDAARVGGHVMALSGGLQRERGAVVAGQLLGGEQGSEALASLFDLFMPAPSPTGGDALIGRLFFGAALGVFLLAFCLLCIALWPGRTAATSMTLGRLPYRALALGLLTTALLALLLLPIAALLTASLVGMPLLVLLMLVAQVPYVYGLAALMRVPGARIAARGGNMALVDRTAIMSAAGLTLLIALVSMAAPLWGLALFYILASPGLGAALLNRGGLLVPIKVAR